MTHGRWSVKMPHQGLLHAFAIFRKWHFFICEPIVDWKQWKTIFLTAVFRYLSLKNLIISGATLILSSIHIFISKWFLGNTSKVPHVSALTKTELRRQRKEVKLWVEWGMIDICVYKDPLNSISVHSFPPLSWRTTMTTFSKNAEWKTKGKILIFLECSL